MLIIDFIFIGINLSCPKVQSPSTQDQVPSNGHINVISKSPHHEKDDSGVSIDAGFNSSTEQVWICDGFKVES